MHLTLILPIKPLSLFVLTVIVFIENLNLKKKSLGWLLGHIAPVSLSLLAAVLFVETVY